MKKITFKEFVLSLGLLVGVTASAQQLYTEPFTTSLNTAIASNGSSGNWIWTGTCGKSSLTGHTTNGSALFQGSSCQFGNGGSVVSGDLTTPAFAIPSLGGILTFNYYLENECGSGNTTCSYDVLSVQMSNNGGSSYTTLMSSNTGTFTNGSAWKSVTYNIAGGQTVSFRFNFNSIDGIGNTYDGVYVDDISIFGILPCTSTPAANTVVATSTLVCPVFGTSSLSIQNPMTGLGGITYSWQASTQSALGPYTNVPGGNMQAYTTPTLAGTTWYQLAMQCVNGGATIAAQSVQIQVASTTTNTVPYFESFEGITQNKQLPNCSWFRNDNFQASTNIAANGWRMPRTGTKFAEFDASNYVYSQTRYYYSNGIQMYPSVTYSASVWYLSPGYSTWYNLGLLYGPNQSPTGLTMLQQIAYPNNTTYNVLTNTFQVPTAGLYYMAVRATEYGYGSQMVWDDLQVIAPCQFTNNAAPLQVAGPTQICAGQQANFTATGAGTYSWNTGVNTASLQVSPPFTTTYSITGTNSLSGCSTTIPKTVLVNQLPPVAIIPFQPEVCTGSSVSMFAVAAGSYTWSAAGGQGPAITVTPAATTIYSVSGSDIFGCVGTATQQIVVNPLPTIGIMPVSKTMCKGETVNLTASGATGATSYMWTSPTSFFQSVTIAASPLTTQTYTVSGTDNKGCVGITNVVVIVEACLSVADVSGNTLKATVFPSPNNGEFTVVLNNGLTKTIEVVDLTGRVVLTNTSDSDETNLNISTLSNGVCYVKIKSANAVDVLKVVKQ